jgi:hypothetical protein
LRDAQTRENFSTETRSTLPVGDAFKNVNTFNNLTPGQKCVSDNLPLGWPRERLAVESGVSVASVYLLERALTAGSEEDARIREALVLALVRRLDSKRLSAREMVVLSRTYLPEAPLLS